VDPFEERQGGTSIEKITAGDERVVIALHSVAWGKASGAPFDVRWAAIFSINAGRVSRVDVHGDWTKALAAAGLEE
jgi:hypothetical protein